MSRHRRHPTKGDLLWRRRGTWSRRTVGGPLGRELAKAHGVHRSWIYKLLARYREGGYEALEPRSRAPRRSPNRTPEEVVRAVVSLREQLLSQGHDCGAETIAHHLAARGSTASPRSRRSGGSCAARGWWSPSPKSALAPR